MAAALRRCLVVAALCGSARGLRTQSLVEPLELDEADLDEAFFDNDADETDSPAVGYDLATPFGIDDATAADWAIAEAIQELHPAKVPSLESRLAATRRVDVSFDRMRNVPQNSTPPNGWPEAHPAPGKWIPEGLRLFYGSHHKAGTNLLRYMCFEQLKVVHGRRCINRGYVGEIPPNCSANANKANVQVWFLGNYTSALGHRIAKNNKYWRAVNMVRDPVAMAVSGYIYHMHVWKDTPPGLEKVRNMSMVDALALEAGYVLQGNGQEMARSYQMNYTNILQMHLEDFTSSSESFDKATMMAFNHLVGDLADEEDRKTFLAAMEKHDLRRNTQDNVTQGNGSHVANKDFKKVVKEAIRHIPDEVMNRLKELRRKVGYTD